MNGGKYAARSMKQVAEEIEGIPVKNIWILDDNFLSSRTRVKEFCGEIGKRGIRKEFIAYGTAHFVAQNPDMMQLLRQAGLTGLLVGFEFVTDEELAAVHKQATVLDNDHTIAICGDLDIELFALFMINPNWTHRDFRKLADYLKTNQMTFATFSTLTLLPGTELAGKENRTFDPNAHWWRYDFLRLHQVPQHMSPLRYYLWLFYLYMLPGQSSGTLRKLRQRYGFWGTLKLIFDSLFIGLNHLVKVLIWR